MDAKEVQNVKPFEEKLDKFVSSKVFIFVDHDNNHGASLRIKIPEVIKLWLVNNFCLFNEINAKQSFWSCG